ncbi:MAG: phage holin family protein [Ruminococcus sp.]|nr:phage holin family protein [Ruminococcus sp.]
MKETICVFFGAFASAVIELFGGWDDAMLTLLIFMAIDYISGLIVAGLFRNSNKSENGGLQSKAGWKGLAKKSMMILFVLISARLDIALGTKYIRSALCIGFICNELISIIENAGLMGIPLPSIIKKSLDILQKNGKE